MTSDPFKTILVGNLSYAVTERHLMREFDRFGRVKKVSLVKDAGTGKLRGYAFIEFERERDVKGNFQFLFCFVLFLFFLL
jgi:U1 small nuclear ribonucleoprotein